MPSPPPLPPYLSEMRRRAEERVSADMRQRLRAAEGADVERLLHDLGVHQIELQMQNEELMRTQLALEASRDRYVDLYEQAPVAYLSFGLDGEIFEANRLAAELLRQAPARLIGRRLFEFVEAADRPRLQQHQRRLLRGEGAQALELRLARGAQAPCWVALEMTLATAEATGANQCRATLFDISERVRMQEGAARLAAIVESSQDAIVGRDPEGRVTSWNAGAEQLFGAAAADVLGRPMGDFVLPERRTEEAQWLERLRAGERIGPLETERVRRDGRRLPLSVGLSPITDAQGQLLGSALIARDIGELKRTEHALHQRLRQLDVLSQAGHLLIMNEPGEPPRYDELFDRVRRAISAEIALHFAIDEAGGHLTLVAGQGLSDAARAALAELPLDGSLCGLVARRRLPLVVESLQASAMAEAAQLKAAGARCYAGFPLLAHGDARAVVAFASTTRARFREGDLQVIQAVCDQVSAMLERGRLTDELRANQQALERADRAKDAFIATLAHELRNPLAPIRNAVGIMSRGDLPDPRLAWCRDVISRQVAQMTHLLEDLLDVSRVTRNKVELRRERVDLRRAIEQAAETMRPLIESQRHRLTLLLPDEPIAVDGDLTRLTQVFANLLSNAAKYTDPGGTIEVDLRRAGGESRVSVRDNGIGIDAQQLPRVFDMFTQIAPTLPRSGSGLGIGLSLARGLVELHGGRIEAKSAGAQRGAEFVVHLPMLDGQSPAEGGTPAGATPQGAAGRRVLVVDDNADAAQTLAMMLGLEGHDVRTAFGGAEALRQAADWAPEVAIVDIGMADMSGYELCRRLREQPWGPQALLVACTGWGQPQDRERAREAGFDAHLVKPIDPAAVFALLSR
ncbi:MAG TPA: PAS domain S-box protein [Ideonella sp.]|nr:PAS domain S-box protein [Ideonella sp.]